MMNVLIKMDKLEKRGGGWCMHTQDWNGFMTVRGFAANPRATRMEVMKLSCMLALTRAKL